MQPGFGAAGDNPSENGFANGNGLGLGNIPPGQFKKFESYDEFGEYSPDDTFESTFNDPIERNFEKKYDKMDKQSKSEEKKEKKEKKEKNEQKDKADREKKAKNGNGNGNSGGGQEKEKKEKK